MIYLGMDIGNKSRNCTTIMDDTGKILHYEYLAYDTKVYSTPLSYRIEIVRRTKELVQEYHVDYMLYEKINLFRGPGVSPLANIISMCKLQTTIINELSDIVGICEVAVQSWKSKILGDKKATKEDAIEYVGSHYPEVNLEIEEYHPRKKEITIVINHDLADSVCIARYCTIVGDSWMKKHLVNYQ